MGLAAAATNERSMVLEKVRTRQGQHSNRGWGDLPGGWGKARTTRMRKVILLLLSLLLLLLLLLLYYHFIILSYAATRDKPKNRAAQKDQACYPGGDRNPGSSIVEGNRC
jgi:hypothetical protein